MGEGGGGKGYSGFMAQQNLDLTKCQGTRKIGSLYRGSVPYILKGRAVVLRTFVIYRFH